MKCLECKEEIEQTPKKREKQFCSSSCRSNYWQKAKRRIKENNKPENKKRILDERAGIPDLVFQKAKSRRMGQKGFINMVEKIDSKINFKEPTNESYDGERISPLIQDEISQFQIPPIPVREPNEDAFDFAARKNEWKRLYGK